MHIKQFKISSPVVNILFNPGSFVSITVGILSCISAILDVMIDMYTNFDRLQVSQHDSVVK